MKLKLKKLRIENFKKVDKFEWDFGAKSWNIYGDNGVGKTTLFDAYIWLLFGKDSKDAIDFNVRKIDQNTKEIQHHNEILVEASLDVDGKELRLKKIQKEKWTKSRGSAELTLSGNVNDFYINDAPVKEQEFKKQVSSLCENEKSFKVASFLGAFNKLEKKEKRQMLFNLTNEITDEALANSVSFDLEAKQITLDNKEIIEDFKARIKEVGFENTRKIAKDTANKINKEIDALPIRINELYNSLSKDQLPTSEEIENKIAEVDDKINKVASQKANTSQEQELAKLQQEKQNKLVSAYNLKDATETKLCNLKSELNTQRELLQANTNLSYNFQMQKENLLTRYKEIKERKFEGNECPVCHRPLPEEELEKAKKDFNANNEKELKENIKAGKELNNKIASLNKNIEDNKAKIDSIIERTNGLQETLENIDFNVDEINAKIEKLSKESSTQYDDELKALNEEKRHLLELAIKVDNQYQTNFRINVLNGQIKEKQKEFGYYIMLQALCDKFLEMKVNKLTEAINRKFKITRFKLFNQLLNGTYEEVCIPQVQGVDYNSLNSAMQRNVDLDIINTIQNEINCICPLWIDNAESCNQYLQVEAQTIKLYVKEQEEKCLEMEVEE